MLAVSLCRLLLTSHARNSKMRRDVDIPVCADIARIQHVGHTRHVKLPRGATIELSVYQSTHRWGGGRCIPVDTSGRNGFPILRAGRLRCPFLETGGVHVVTTRLAPDDFLFLVRGVQFHEADWTVAFDGFSSRFWRGVLVLGAAEIGRRKRRCIREHFSEFLQNSKVSKPYLRLVASQECVILG